MGRFGPPLTRHLEDLPDLHPTRDNKALCIQEDSAHHPIHVGQLGELTGVHQKWAGVTGGIANNDELGQVRAITRRDCPDGEPGADFQPTVLLHELRVGIDEYRLLPNEQPVGSLGEQKTIEPHRRSGGPVAETRRRAAGRREWCRRQQ